MQSSLYDLQLLKVRAIMVADIWSAKSTMLVLELVFT